METWLPLEEFAEITGYEEERVLQMIDDGYLQSKEESGEVYIEASSSTSALVPKSSSSELEESGSEVSSSFAEKTIGTILHLHQKVLESKDETISSLKDENKFLKDALFSMQEVYDEDKKTIGTLSDQLKISQDELEFVKRKYKLMWGKVIEENSRKGDE
ncbi:MAG: DUF3972 domain-containing protein [Campylobacterales bacterium]